MSDLPPELKQALRLCQAGRRRDALDAARPLVERDWASGQDYGVLAGLFSALDEHATALCLYDKAIALDTARADLFYNRATAQRFLGAFEDAEASCDRALALRPGDAAAQYLRSSLRTQTPQRNHLAQLQAAQAAAADAEARSFIGYALAKEHEDLGQYDAAFAAMQAAGAARRSRIAYDVAQDERIMQAIAAAYPADTAPAPGSSPGACEDSPVFIVGLPRTGTTLVERILTRSGEIKSAGERGEFALELSRLTAQAAPGVRLAPLDMVVASARIDFAQLGQRYVASVRQATDIPGRFIDKLPLNFLYVGLIARALPNARIIHVSRSPMDTALAIYKQPFERLYPFSYALGDIARYYVAYAGLMLHWRSAMPDRMVEVAYEDLIADPGQVAQRLLALCDLPWTPDSLDLADHPGAVTTASAVQARRPIYASSVGLWRRYETHLRPLRRDLQALGVTDLD
jgi:tetratricopeptide (TPR) repeat protein